MYASPMIDTTKQRKYIKDLRALLKDIEPAVKSFKPMQTGRELKNFSLRPREVWANWLLCAVLHKVYSPMVTFTDDDDGDGIIVDGLAGDYIEVEHVCALDTPEGQKPSSGTVRIIEAIELKTAKGEGYSRGKLLVVFFDGAGNWYRDKVREAINGRHHFERIYLIGLLTDKGGTKYSYSVTELYEDDSTTYAVKITPDFTDWSVSRIP